MSQRVIVKCKKQPYCRSIAKERDLAHHAYLRLPLLRQRGVNKTLKFSPSTVTKHSRIYDGHHATKYDGIHVIHENDHANTGSKPKHGVTATCRLQICRSTNNNVERQWRFTAQP